MFLGTYAVQFVASTAAYCALSCCSAASKEVLRHSARVAWSALFFLAMVTAWLMRDFAKPLLEKLPCEFSSARLFQCVQLFSVTFSIPLL